MKFHQREISLPSYSRGFHLITEIIEKSVPEVKDITIGQLTVFIKHTSASLTLTDANNLAYSCSFVPAKYIGLDVRDPVDFGTRLYGIFIAGVPLGFLLAVYSFLVWPLKPVQQVTE